MRTVVASICAGLVVGGVAVALALLIFAVDQVPTPTGPSQPNVLDVALTTAAGTENDVPPTARPIRPAPPPLPTAAHARDTGDPSTTPPPTATRPSPTPRIVALGEPTSTPTSQPSRQPTAMATIVVLFQRATLTPATASTRTPPATASKTPRPAATSPPAAPTAVAAVPPADGGGDAPAADAGFALAAEPDDLGDDIRAEVADRVAAAGLPDRSNNDRRDDDD